MLIIFGIRRSHLMHIAPLAEDDLAAVPTLQPQDWDYDISPAIAYYTRSSFCFPVKASIDGHIVGMGASIIHSDVAWLAHIIVHPNYRNRGLGRLITQTLISSPEIKGCSTIYLIATDMGAPVYTKLGFEIETEYLFYKNINLAPTLPVSEIISYTPAHKAKIAELDRAVSGENRVLHLEEYLNNSFVYHKNDRIEGFYLPSLGEGLIIAATSTAGSALLQLRLTSKTTLVFPEENRDASLFMHHTGNQEVRRAKRMRLGLKRDWRPANIYSRIGGNLG